MAATLLDLTTQGDVATISDERKLSQVRLMTPRQLYELWERQNWASHEIDLAQDRRDWEAMDDEQRESISWGLANFFVGEERVTTQFSGLVMAYEDQHEEAFLATQQVDEARHAQHFNRLYEQVLRYDGSFEDRLERCRGAAERALPRALRRAPRGREPGADRRSPRRRRRRSTSSRPITWSSRARSPSPVRSSRRAGWSARTSCRATSGFKKISQDEHRHVAYGTWFLQQKAQDPALAQRIQDQAWSPRCRPPPACSSRLASSSATSTSTWGYSSQEINAFAFTALSRRLKVIGVGLPAVTA